MITFFIQIGILNKYFSDDISIVLKNSSNLTVPQLLESIKLTREFESSMQRRFNVKVC